MENPGIELVIYFNDPFLLILFAALSVICVKTYMYRQASRISKDSLKKYQDFCHRKPFDSH